jgi:hypothetical protein
MYFTFFNIDWNTKWLCYFLYVFYLTKNCSSLNFLPLLYVYAFIATNVLVVTILVVQYMENAWGLITIDEATISVIMQT